MRTYDLSPLFRSTVGFDHLTRVLDALQTDDVSSGYPPYNIEKAGNDTYRIVMAVAGFSANEIELVTGGDSLVVRGKGRTDDDKTTYLYRGIGPQTFERRFQLADYVQVTDAVIENGLLRITLARLVPDALKPRRIAINATPPMAPDIARISQITDKAA